MTNPPSATAARLLNLIVPGGGLIAAGAVWRGLLVGLTFTALVNTAIVFGLIIPDAAPPESHFYPLCVAATAVLYVAAQVWLERVIRRREHGQAHAARRRLLREVAELMEANRAAEAVDVLRPHEPLVDSDVLLALRLAQALHTVMHDEPRTKTEAGAATLRMAWLRVRRLDAHRLYRAEVEAALTQLDEA